MNTNVMFSSKSDLWETPQDLFDKLDAEFRFTMDVCALPENAKCARYYTPEQDGLHQPWDGIVWCNPPYGREIGKWVEKAHYSTYKGITTVMLLDRAYKRLKGYCAKRIICSGCRLSRDDGCVLD